MAKAPDKGIFTPKNPDKYIGANLGQITYRSSWELTAMLKFDQHPNIIQWASEPFSVPYKNPLTGRWTMYMPDFLLVYVDRSGKQHTEVVEIKPLGEVPGAEIISERTGRPLRLSKRQQLTRQINAAKWQACASFCAKRGLFFRIITEKQLFGR